MQDISTILRKSPGKLYILYPHPDDESAMSGGLITTALKYAWQVKVVCLTHGEAGKVYVNGHGKSMRELRSHELQMAMEYAGVEDWVIEGYPDGGLTKSRKWQPFVRESILHYQPDIIVTYDHSGLSGHPDHIALSIEVVQLLRDCRHKHAWARDLRLWWASAAPGRMAAHLVNELVIDHWCEPNLKLNLGLVGSLKKWRIIRFHKSQRIGTHLPLPLWLLMLLYRVEYYYQVDFKRQYSHEYIDFKI